MKIAYFSPLNPIRSGISDYSEALLPCLRKHAGIELFIDYGYYPSNKRLLKGLKLNWPCEFEKNSSGFDLNLFQLGNHSCHSYMYPILLRHHGLTVLHDLVLYGMVWGYAAGKQGRKVEMLGQLWKNNALAKAIANGFKLNDFDFPLNRQVIDSSSGIIVHSDFLKQAVEKINKSLPVRKILHGANPIDLGHGMQKSRRLLGLGQQFGFVGCSFGFVQEHKRIWQVLKAFKLFLERNPGSVFVICGKRDKEFDVDAEIRKLGLQGNVVVTGYVTREKALEYINASDLCFNLRWPSTGATSGSLMTILSVGKPCVVSDLPEFSEFPDDCAVKVPLGEGEVGLLVDAMERFKNDGNLQKRMSRNARNFVSKNCLWKKVAKQYIEFGEECRK